jgi:biotin carboxyl carrier protein
VSRAAGRILLAAGLGVFIIGLIQLYRSHRAEGAREAEREGPVVPATRVEEAEGRALVVLDTATIRRIGLRLARLQPARGPAYTRVPGEVIAEPERTSIVRAPVTGRLSSLAETPWPRLGVHLSRGQEIARVSDARPLTAPLSGTVLRVAAQPGEVVESGQVLFEIVDNSHPVVRIPWAATDGRSPPALLRLQPPDTAIQVGARLVGPAAEADPATRRPAYLYRAERRWAGAAPGTPVWALMTDTTADAGLVVVPSGAVVQWEGLAWAYVQRGPGRYERVPVPTTRPVTDGWLAGPPLNDRDSVVVTGTQELLSEEFRARVTVGEESGE